MVRRDSGQKPRRPHNRAFSVQRSAAVEELKRYALMIGIVPFTLRVLVRGGQNL